MLVLINLVLTLVTVILLAATAMLGLEIFTARRPDQETAEALSEARPSTIVLVPAHNEAGQITATLEALKPQLGPSDMVIVIADNCTDDTAAIARSQDAMVLERNDAVHRGKGYALQFGLDYLTGDPPDVVMILDADCRAEPKAVDVLARATGKAHRPIQALYLMEASTDAGLGEKLAAFAFTVKNQIRPSGLKQLGLPCPLTGTGMAFPGT